MMKRITIMISALFAAVSLPLLVFGAFETDRIATSGGPLTIGFIGHGSLFFEFAGKTIYVDPYSKLADYSSLKKADLIVITHDHYDHLDLKAIEAITTKKTTMVVTETCYQQVKKGVVMKNGDVKTIAGLKIEAVPAYNLKHKRDDGKPFHPRGMGNGYVIHFADTVVYVAGDTENIPEMKALNGRVHIAFLPMNLPYTMTPEMTADAAAMIQPKICYPYHFGETDMAKFTALMKNRKDIEVRIRRMK